MNDDARREALLRRGREAADLARRASAAAETPRPPTEALRFGVAEIVGNDGGGAYTVDEQWWRASGGGAWCAATRPLGYAAAAARDYRNDDGGKAGQLVRFWEQRAAGGAIEVLLDVASTPEGVARATGVERALDLWIDVTQSTSKTYLDDPGDDWRGRALWYSVRPYTGVDEETGTPANADEDEWDDDGQDADAVRCVVVGRDWDADADEGADVILWQTAQTRLYLERDTGRLYLWCCFDRRRQLRLTLRATAAKASGDEGVPEITI